MWFMAYGFMMFAYIMALRAKLSGDGFQFEVLLSWICGGDTFPLRFLETEFSRLLNSYILIYHGPTNSSMSWKNPRWVSSFLFEVSVHPSWGQTTQVPRLAGRPQILYNLEDDDGNSNLDHLEFVPKIVWKISAERNKNPKIGGLVSIIVYVHPYLKIPILTNICQMGWNHHLETVKEDKVYIYT